MPLASEPAAKKKESTRARFPVATVMGLSLALFFGASIAFEMCAYAGGKGAGHGLGNSAGGDAGGNGLGLGRGNGNGNGPQDQGASDPGDRRSSADIFSGDANGRDWSGQQNNKDLPSAAQLDDTLKEKDWDKSLKLDASRFLGLKPEEKRKELKDASGVHDQAQRAFRSTREGGAALDSRSYIHNEVLAANLSATGLAQATALGFTPLPIGGGVTKLIVPQGMDAAQALDLLAQNLPQENFQLNRVYRLYQPAMKDDGSASPPRDASLAGKGCSEDHCYAQLAIGWKPSFATCARNVKIGVIDTGFDLAHPAFLGQDISHKAFVSQDTRAAAEWHGTGVLALLAGRPESGTPGLVPQASFLVASTFYLDADGEAVTDTVTLSKALDWMAASGAKIVNMSFAGPKDDLIEAKIESLAAKGIIFIAAAGNEGPTAAPAFPAAYPQVLAVTAVTKDLKNYPYANRGPHIDLAAPGVNIWTAYPGAREGYRSGTSFAAPFATAVLAVLPQEVLHPPKNGLMDAIRVKALGNAGQNPVYGRGLIQAPAKCQAIGDEVADIGSDGGRPR